MIQVKWLGAAGLEFSYNKNIILIDPYISRNTKRDIFFKKPVPDIRKVANYQASLSGNISAVIAGHTHLDHALDIPEFSKRFDGPVIGSESLDTLLELHSQKNRVTVTQGNEPIPLSEDVTLTMIPSEHGLALFGKVPYPGEIDKNCRIPLQASDYKHGKCFIPKLTINGKTFMHFGSANFTEKDIKGHQADVLFMCLPGWKKVPEYTKNLVTMLAPEVIVPFHFDDFSAPLKPDGTPKLLPFQDLKGFIKNIKKKQAPNIRLIVPQYMKPLTF